MRSYRTVSPSPHNARRHHAAVCFLWHYPASHLGLPLATALLCGVRTFLDQRPGCTVTCTRFLEPRPPGQLVRTDHPTVMTYSHRMDDIDARQYAALLRGINVGGIRIKMADLRRVLSHCGLKNVRTVLASGNVMFEVAHDTNPDTLRDTIEAALTNEFGYEAKVFVVEMERLRAIVAAYPFDREREGWHPYVVFLADDEALEQLLEGGELLDPETERIARGERVLYWEVERGHTLRSQVGTHTAKPKIKVLTTTRNLRTLIKMLE